MKKKNKYYFLLKKYRTANIDWKGFVRQVSKISSQG